MTSDGFLEVPHEHAGAYMFYLSAAVAERRALSMTTDSSDYWAVGTYFANEGSLLRTFTTTRLTLTLPIWRSTIFFPNDLESVSVDVILRFREDTAELRNAFQHELKALREEISRCNNKEHARYIVEDFVSRFERAKTEYRESLSFFRRCSICSIFSVGLPAAIAFVSLPMVGAGDPFTPVPPLLGGALRGDLGACRA